MYIIEIYKAKAIGKDDARGPYYLRDLQTFIGRPGLYPHEQPFVSAAHDATKFSHYDDALFFALILSNKPVHTVNYFGIILKYI